MKADTQLLRDYAEAKSQDAFAELVRRHLDLVYSAALRQVRSPQLAEEISQSVFTDLARAADQLKPDTVLTAWLYQVARRTAIDVIRRESRRQARERLAVEMAAMNTSADWTHIEPLLDDAMETLDEPDRAAILLRFFENKSLREVGQSLGTSDDAAQKRVSRAVERLREFFSKRGIAIGASGLIVLVSANAVQSAPVALVATIFTAATLAGTAVHTSATIATTKAVAMTTLQKTVVATTIAVLAGTGIYQARQNSQLREQNQALQQQQTPLAEQVRQLQTNLTEANSKLADLLAENARAKTNSAEAELLKLRGEVGVLQAELADAKNRKGQPEQPALSSAREYYNRATQHHSNHDYEAELADLNKAIELDPNMAEAYLSRADLYGYELPKEKGGQEKALPDFTRALELKPNDSSARWNRAQAFRQLRRYDDSVADWTTYIEGDTDFSNQVDGKIKSIASAYLQRGQVYEMYLHDYSKAIADYTSALQMYPNLEDAHRLRGMSYESLGETDRAQEDFAIEPKR